jgi:hypothetical protein
VKKFKNDWLATYLDLLIISPSPLPLVSAPPDSSKKSVILAHRYWKTLDYPSAEGGSLISFKNVYIN